MRGALALFAVLVVATGCAGMTRGTTSSSAGVARTFLNPSWLGTPPADFTQTVAVSGGQTIYVSAQTAWDPNRSAVVGPADFRAQAVRAFERLKIAVEAANASLADVVKLRIYVKDYRAEYLEVLHDVIGNNFPK